MKGFLPRFSLFLAPRPMFLTDPNHVPGLFQPPSRPDPRCVRHFLGPRYTFMEMLEAVMAPGQVKRKHSLESLKLFLGLTCFGHDWRNSSCPDASANHAYVQSMRSWSCTDLGESFGCTDPVMDELRQILHLWKYWKDPLANPAVEQI